MGCIVRAGAQAEPIGLAATQSALNGSPQARQRLHRRMQDRAARHGTHVHVHAPARAGGITVVAACPAAATDCTGPLMEALASPNADVVVMPATPRSLWPVHPLALNLTNGQQRSRKKNIRGVRVGSSFWFRCPSTRTEGPHGGVASYCTTVVRADRPAKPNWPPLMDS